jgi:DNA-directed RNA polymerase subunit M/transcription elongation factor TFIIS
MPLPVLETTKYTTVVPSTQEKVEFRPFLVKEEKILMIAQESQDSSQTIKALKEIVSACTFNVLKLENLTTYDLEYLFLQLRVKSVGEVSDISLKCSKCGEVNSVSVDLSEINVQFPEKESERKIELTDTIGITLRPISIDKVGELSNLEKNEDSLTKSVAACIESIYDSNGLYMTDDTSEKEMAQFVDSLSHKHLELIQDFMSNQPELRKVIKFKCSACGHENEITATGLQSFF